MKKKQKNNHNLSCFYCDLGQSRLVRYTGVRKYISCMTLQILKDVRFCTSAETTVTLLEHSYR